MSLKRSVFFVFRSGVVPSGVFYKDIQEIRKSSPSVSL